MGFDKKNLLKLGKLARISINDDKLGSLGEDLNSILKFVDQLQEIKTDEIVNFLCERDCDINVKDRWGNTPLSDIKDKIGDNYDKIRDLLNK